MLSLKEVVMQDLLLISLSEKEEEAVVDDDDEEGRDNEGSSSYDGVRKSFLGGVRFAEVSSMSKSYSATLLIVAIEKLLDWVLELRTRSLDC